MNNNYIIEMIKSGELLELKLGLSPKEISSIIEETAVITALNSELDLWNYGYGLELFLENDKLTKFSIRTVTESGQFELPQSFKRIQNNELENLSSIDLLIDILKVNEINWSINKNLCDDEHICITCNDLVDIYYSLDRHHIYNIQSRGLDWHLQQNKYWSEKNNRSI